MAIRRTTLAAEADDLARLEQEAQRRGISLSRLLREVVEREAAELRRKRRPRFGIGRSGGIAMDATESDSEPIEAHPYRS